MTVIRPNSISGVTSITARGGEISYFKSDGTRGNQFTHNIHSTGIITATSFSGNLTGNLSGGTINATSGTVTGNLGVGGVLTYEDVTNVDSIGVITARSGIDASSNLLLKTGGSERLRINSSGRVSISTTTEGHGNADEFTISFNNNGVSGGDQGRCGMTIRSGENTSNVMQNGYIYFSDGTSGGNEYRGVVAYRHSDDSMYFSTSGTERLCIKSDGSIDLKTDGRGIQFPTPQTPTNANNNRVGISSEMRYYETGTLTPGLSSTVLNSLQNPAFTDASYARRVCRYVRVGHLVHVTAEILMASSVTYAAGVSDSTAPVCITGVTPFRYAYNERYDVSGQPDYYPCSISYSSSNLTNDTLYAVLRRDFPAEARFEITKPGSGGSRQYNSTNFGEVFPANGHIIVSCTYAIDTGNADY